MKWYERLAMEPPFRVFARALLKNLHVSVDVRSSWELSDRPAYLLGVLTASKLAKLQGLDRFSVVEFGVAGGRGLLALEKEAAAVGRETGVTIDVYGFDCGESGLPEFIGDHRDHPDRWRAGDYPMDVESLKRQLTDSTRLILGNVEETVDEFVECIQQSPLGFASIDLDLYSSTKKALRILSHHQKQMLRQMVLYFDDVGAIFNHKFAGELLAIEEFNAENETVKIDKWRGVKADRPFPNRPFLEQMYIAHDLESISATNLQRPVRELNV